jgi:hypothetical protein
MPETNGVSTPPTTTHTASSTGLISTFLTRPSAHHPLGASSLEHVDYSICTLEFESRRESYFWLLEALDLYRPKVYEMSRLNIAYTVLSKRKLLKLVTAGVMSGWDDPRMPTIKVSEIERASSCNLELTSA